MRPLVSGGRSRRDFVGESRDLVDEVVEVGGDGFDDELVDACAGIAPDLLGDRRGVAGQADAGVAGSGVSSESRPGLTSVPGQIAVRPPSTGMTAPVR
jgi:hypothetical protein